MCSIPCGVASCVVERKGSEAFAMWPALLPPLLPPLLLPLKKLELVVAKTVGEKDRVE